MSGTRPHRTGVTFGNGSMYMLLIRLMRHIDVKFFYFISTCFVIPITMITSHGSRVAYRYFRHYCQYGRLRSLRSTFVNHSIFGKTVIDKFAMYAGQSFVLHIHGREIYEAMTNRPEPFLQLSAHIGCCEILGYSYPVSKTCNVLAYGGEKAELMQYRRTQFGNMNIRIIPVGTSENHSDEIISVIERGEIINAFADRFEDVRKTITSHIHGCTVRLAKGPFQLAVTQGMNVIMANAMKERDGSYTAYFTSLYYDKSQPKSMQRQQLADAYTAEIERLLDIYPMQWFNYFEIYESETEG